MTFLTTHDSKQSKDLRISPSTEWGQEHPATTKYARSTELERASEGVIDRHGTCFRQAGDGFVESACERKAKCERKARDELSLERWTGEKNGNQ